MGTLFDEAALVKHQDVVSLSDRGEPVGDHNGGASLHQLFKGILHQPLRFGVKRGGGFIEN